MIKFWTNWLGCWAKDHQNGAIRSQMIWCWSKINLFNSKCSKNNIVFQLFSYLDFQRLDFILRMSITRCNFSAKTYARSINVTFYDNSRRKWTCVRVRCIREARQIYSCLSPDLSLWLVDFCWDTQLYWSRRPCHRLQQFWGMNCRIVDSHSIHSTLKIVLKCVLFLK